MQPKRKAINIYFVYFAEFKKRFFFKDDIVIERGRGNEILMPGSV